MSISFNNIPSDIRRPWAYIEFDNTGAVQGSSRMTYKVAIQGQKLAGGTAVAGKLYLVTSADQARTLFGAGSMLHLMAVKYFKNNSYTATYMVALEDDAAGVATTKTLTFSGAVTAAGVVPLLIDGKSCKASVAVGDAPSAIATAVASAINADTSLPFSASAAAAVLTLTAKWKGATGNDLDVRACYYDDEELPAGLSLAITNGISGATNPSITPAIDAMAPEQFNVVVCPYRDATSLTALKDDLEDRWGPLNQKDGVAIIADVDSLANLATFGASQNTQLFTCAGIKGLPNAAFEFAAALAGIVAYQGAIDPARPMRTLELKGILPPAVADRFSSTENNTLLFDGISTFYVDASGSVRIERLITMYRKNDAGADDTSYLDLSTVLTLSYLRYDFRTMILSKYPRHKLADDGKLYGAGQAIITPSVGKAEAVAKFREWEELGLVELDDNFASGIIVERDSTDQNRLNFLLAPDLVNQFLVAGVQIKFIL